MAKGSELWAWPPGRANLVLFSFSFFRVRIMRQLHANGMSRQRKKEAAARVLLTVLVSARGRDGFLGIRSVGSASFRWLVNGSDFFLRNWASSGLLRKVARRVLGVRWLPSNCVNKKKYYNKKRFYI